MTTLIKIDKEYATWISTVAKEYKSAQIKATRKVNSELLHFYFNLGKDIVNLQAEAKWGNKFFDNLSQDLKDIFPNTKGFSKTNIKYMKYFYLLYSPIRPQVVDELESNENYQNAWDEISLIPWGHHGGELETQLSFLFISLNLTKSI